MSEFPVSIARTKLAPQMRQVVQRAADYNFSPARFTPELLLISGVGALGGLGLGTIANSLNSAIQQAQGGEVPPPIIDLGIAAAIGAGLTPAATVASMRAAKSRAMNQNLRIAQSLQLGSASEVLDARDALKVALADQSGRTAASMLGSPEKDRLVPLMSLLNLHRTFDYGS